MDNFSSRELVRRALSGLPVPRVATGPLAVHYCARLNGVSLREYTLNPRVMADCVIRYHERFRPDAVWLSADTWVTAQAMGAAVAFPDADQPLGGTGAPRVRKPDDLEQIPPPDVTTQGRYPLMLEALRLIRQGVGDDVFVVACFDQYPFSAACGLMGIERAMVAARNEPDFLRAVMARCAEYAVAYALALGREGADLLSGGDSPAGLLGPALWREIAAPLEEQVIKAIKAGCEQPVSLHICGNALPIIRAMEGRCRADVLELDYQVDLAKAGELLGSEVAIWGNLNPVGLLAQGTAGEVRRECERVKRAMAACGHRRFVLSSGCTLALETPAANLDAMFERE